MTDTSSRSTRRRLPYWVRWLHLYGSMLGLMATLLFAVTGLTLNHADWFESGEPSLRSLEGSLDPAALRDPVDKLAVAEALRAAHALRGSVGEFAVDDEECLIVWKGPGYSADATVARATGAYRLEEQRRGFVAVLDDLHKGRDSGPTWSLIVDVSAMLLTLIAATGLWLLFYLKKRLRNGLLVALVGTVLLVAAFALGVP
ncbi:MAG: PepSY-associated TM helix domain-containing protein [Planctomycetes bacterium]|nr:PepSY-associated TM helix domain-containing protein [Planctomycetota bacterium]